MQRRVIRDRVTLVVGVTLLVIFARIVGAENIDPDADGSQYAWAENLGWVNLEPLGDGGPGVQVDDFELTGWMWSENAGWISLSCRTTGSCSNVDYGVANDGSGNLSGHAWSENAGWIDFAPTGGGVDVDPANGKFRGYAWSENAGWIRFASVGTTAFGVTTGWRCDPAPAAPIESPDLRVTRVAGGTRLS